MRLENKRVVITGSASGIGRATAQLMAKEGAKLVLADVNEAGLKETATRSGMPAAHRRWYRQTSRA